MHSQTRRKHFTPRTPIQKEAVLISGPAQSCKIIAKNVSIASKINGVAASTTSDARRKL